VQSLAARQQKPADPFSFYENAIVKGVGKGGLGLTPHELDILQKLYYLRNED